MRKRTLKGASSSWVERRDKSESIKYLELIHAIKSASERPQINAEDMGGMIVRIVPQAYLVNLIVSLMENKEKKYGNINENTTNENKV